MRESIVVQAEDGMRGLVRSRELRDVYKIFFLQEKDSIRELVQSRELGDVYKRQALCEVLPMVKYCPSSNVAHRQVLPVVKCCPS